MKHVRSSSVVWDMRRFGLTPSKSLGRFFNGDMPKIYCTSMPKAGTHLLERLLCLHPKLYRSFIPTLKRDTVKRYDPVKIIGKLRGGQILISHQPYDTTIKDAIERASLKHLLILRDPRDVIISDIFWARKLESHYAHSFFTECTDMTEAIERYIRGIKSNDRTIAEVILRYKKWMPFAHVVYFEELRGSGNIAGNDQKTVVYKVFKYLGISVDEQWVDGVLNELFSAHSPTFRKGKSGEWMEYFSDKNKESFKEIAGGLLVDLGYENGMDW